MRLSYVDNPPKNLSAEDEQILERVKARRGERGLLPLDLALLHAPKVADGMSPTEYIQHRSPSFLTYMPFTLKFFKTLRSLDTLSFSPSNLNSTLLHFTTTDTNDEMK